MKNKTTNYTLVMITSDFPNLTGEVFVHDEISITSKKFKNIIVFTPSIKGEINYPPLPDNIKVIEFDNEVVLLDKLHYSYLIFLPIFIQEFFLVLLKLRFKYFFLGTKIILMDLVRAKKLKNSILNYSKLNKLKTENTIYYSYWHDYKALALSILKKGNKNFKCISRAHGWDVFAERQKITYLPFKRFIIRSLNCSLSVSEAGKKELFDKYAPFDRSKLIVSKLGVINNNLPKNNSSNSIIICSCSNMIKVKRIHLIIDVLSKMNMKNILWVHFGDGPLKNELMNLAKTKLDKIKYCFKGMIATKEILDYYSNNNVDLFINLSESEGIPVSIMEALSAGIPVLATNVGGTSEAVNNNLGFLIEKDLDTQEISEIVQNYLNSSKENKDKYRNAAFDFWSTNFNGTKNYEEFSELLLNID